MALPSWAQRIHSEYPKSELEQIYKEWKANEMTKLLVTHLQRELRKSYEEEDKVEMVDTVDGLCYNVGYRRGFRHKTNQIVKLILGK